MTEQITEEIVSEVTSEDPVKVSDYSKQPTNEDDNEYWKGFAAENGWKEDREAAPDGEYKDYKAFVRFYDKTSETKQLREDVSGLKKSLNDIAASQGEYGRMMEEQQQKEIEQVRASYEKQKEQAKEDNDFDAFEEADKNLKSIDSQKPASDEAEVFASFRANNPELLKTGDSFDQELNDKIEASVNYALQAGAITSKDQIPQFLETALEQEKAKLERYAPKAPRTPPPTNAVTRRKSVNLSPSSLDGASRAWYDSMIEKGNTGQAEAFLKARLARGTE